MWDLLGLLGKFGLLDRDCLLGFAGKGLLSQVCRVKFAVSGLLGVRFIRSGFLSQVCWPRFAWLGFTGFGVWEGALLGGEFPGICCWYLLGWLGRFSNLDNLRDSLSELHNES